MSLWDKAIFLLVAVITLIRHAGTIKAFADAVMSRRMIKQKKKWIKSDHEKDVLPSIDVEDEFYCKTVATNINQVHFVGRYATLRKLEQS